MAGINASTNGGNVPSNKRDFFDTFCQPPEVCADAEDNKQEHLIKHTTDSDASYFKKTMQRDKDLFIAIIAMVLLMHIPYLKFTMYPFLIFSTWVHESCHGAAAILVGGRIAKLYIYKDGSGLCYTSTSGETWKRAIVSSAGYTGTALIGAMLLMFRRTRRGPTAGLIGMGCAMILSVALYVRNTFGIVSILLMGIATAICGWKLPVKGVTYLYCFLAATCSFNALDSIKDLLGMQEGEAYVNGQESSTDAMSVANQIGMTAGFWAMLWLIFGLIMSAIGLFLPFDGNTTRRNKKELKENNQYAGHHAPQIMLHVHQEPMVKATPVNLPETQATLY